MFVSFYIFDKYIIAIGPRIITVFQLMRAVLPDTEYASAIFEIKSSRA